jgi:hypothetical protein
LGSESFDDIMSASCHLVSCISTAGPHGARIAQMLHRECQRTDFPHLNISIHITQMVSVPGWAYQNATTTDPFNLDLAPNSTRPSFKFPFRHPGRDPAETDLH